ncbi:MAG: hypothetical protein U9O94_01370 [Nanoarchaeota archaeon]|nr:hypothetical protein [Nanoarchaeota archaeon]
MKLSELIIRVKLEVPNMNQTGLNDTEIAALLNQACDQVNLLTKVYKTYTDFNIVAEKRSYLMSEDVPTFLGTDKRGLFFKDSNNDWQDITPKTLGWISERYPDFLNASSAALPRWYWFDGDLLEFHEPPSTTKSSGARLYHLKKSGSMSGDDDYPFTGTSSQITAFLPLDDALIAYCKWKIAPAFGVVQDIDLRQRDFINECKKAAMQIKRRRDLTNDSSYRMGK